MRQLDAHEVDRDLSPEADAASILSEVTDFIPLRTSSPIPLTLPFNISQSSLPILNVSSRDFLPDPDSLALRRVNDLLPSPPPSLYFSTSSTYLSPPLLSILNDSSASSTAVNVHCQLSRVSSATSNALSVDSFEGSAIARLVHKPVTFELPFLSKRVVRLADVVKLPICPKLQRIIRGTSPLTFVTINSSIGKRPKLTHNDSSFIQAQVNQMADCDIIIPIRRQPFLSYPFLVSKASGKPRMVVDFSHLRNHYKTPYMYLPPFSAVLREKFFVQRNDFMARVDLASAFYSVELPHRLKSVSTFLVNNKRYAFQRLPMGLWISPFILQQILLALIRSLALTSKVWVHIDDIIIVNNRQSALHNDLITLFYGLHNLGFCINVRKSQLYPTRQIQFCGLFIDSETEIFNIQNANVSHFIQQFRGLGNRSRRNQQRLLGFLAYWLYSLGLSSALRSLAYKDSQALSSVLLSGPWPLPRPPQQLYAADAAVPGFRAGISQKSILFCEPTTGTIYEEELKATLDTAKLAMPHSIICVDNRAVFFGTRRSKQCSKNLIKLSLLCARKDLIILWLPSRMNPADVATRQWVPKRTRLQPLFNLTQQIKLTAHNTPS